MKLSRGMVIDALIEARLLGKRLLTLKAEITVLPAATRAVRRPHVRVEAASRAAPRPHVRVDRLAVVGAQPLTARSNTPLARANGQASGALSEAARSLAASAADLGRARAQTPRR